MPSPNAAIKSSGRKVSEKDTGDFGQKLAKRRSQDFAAKIQGWQDSGGGVAQQDDGVVVSKEQRGDRSGVKTVAEVVVDADDVNDEEMLHADSPTTAGAPNAGTRATSRTPTPRMVAKELTIEVKAASKDIDLERQAWVRRKSKPQAEIIAEVKDAVAPKKRVVSDGHWRRDKLPANVDITTPEKSKERESTPRPVTIRRSVVSVGLKVPPSIHDFVETDPEPEPLRVRPLRRSKSRDRERTPTYEDSGTKVYIKRRKRSSTDAKEDARTSGSSITAGSSTDKPSTVSTNITTPARSPTKEMPPRPATVPKERPVRRSLEAIKVQRPVSSHKGKTPAGSPVGATPLKYSPSPNHSPKPVEKPAHRPAAPITPPVFGNRIQGWLAAMPDPFVDDKARSLTPQPLNVSRKKSDKTTNTDLKDSREDELIRKQNSSGKRRQPRRSLEPAAIDRPADKPMQVDSPSDHLSDPSSPATPTLRRSGARRNAHSPVKDRGAHASSPLTNVPAPETTVSDARLRRQLSTARDFERRIPSTGKRLSTIASINTFESHTQRQPHDARSEGSDHPTVKPEGSVLSRASDGDEPSRNVGGLKRRLTKHSDLMSVLSLPKEENPGLVSARSIRTRRAKTGEATVEDLMNEVTTDELKYQRELRTLVDGVIPVLLTHVLQKSDTAGVKRLFSGSATSNTALTAPIVEMGVALERLKSAHRRVPMYRPEDLISWAQSASKAYGDYLCAWRLGFHDIVVNLAPAEESRKKDGSPGWDHDLQRDKDGDLLSGDGERVDVAYLLKRPLIRLKYLVKTLKGISQLLPSTSATEMVAKYEGLVDLARQRANDERARLEDEAAASIDATRARDPQSLAPLNGVSIDPSRSVRARDYFDLELLHSNGQRLGCKIEAIIRDDAPDRGTASDILFCEVSTIDRWLLLPPILASNVSARKGDRQGEMVVMVRGVLTSGREWRELLVLQSEDDGAVEEWLGMLPSQPIPSRLFKQSSFNLQRSVPTDGPYMPGALPLTMESLREVDVPIGERAMPTSMKWDGSEVNSVVVDDTSSFQRSKAERHQSMPSSRFVEKPHRQAQEAYLSGPRGYGEEPHYSSASRYRERPQSVDHRSSSDWKSTSPASTPHKGYSVWLPSSEAAFDESNADDWERPPPPRPGIHRRTSSVPSSQLPTIPKARKASEPFTPERQSRNERSNEPARTRGMDEPASAPAKLQKRRPDLSKYDEPMQEEGQAPKPPEHTKPTSAGLRSRILPSFAPAFLKKLRRSSSPLKHEYEPSTASESLSESDFSDIDDAESITSESSAGEGAISTIGELKDFTLPGSLRPASKPQSPRSDFSMSGGSLRPSESASEAPFRHVPPPTAEPAESVACIFSWSDRGSWDSLHTEECSIVVTPGLIEAFDLTQAHDAALQSGGGELLSPSARGIKPLVALELTPLVPLRRGTALDISIRSPPMPNSSIRTGNNVMFRSRSPEECEKLYHLINRARIDNPTYMALQNARGPSRSNWGEVMDQRNAARTQSSSWLRLGSRRNSTYRSTGSRPTSIAATESSVGTMNTAFSALRRFSGSNRIFNIAKSTLTSREGTRSSYSDSLSSGAATPMPLDPKMGTPLGITNAKVRLYIRETASKWRDMGSARLTVMLPPRSDPAVAANPKAAGLGKRVVVCGKSKGETLLDVTLGESAFERVARTGIAVSVWEELDEVAARGGVVGSSSKVYMIQMKSERDAAYTFGMVGKLRY